MGLVFSTTSSVAGCLLTSFCTVCLTHLFSVAGRCLCGIHIKSWRLCKFFYLLLIVAATGGTLTANTLLPRWTWLMRHKSIAFHECYVPYGGAASSINQQEKTLVLDTECVHQQIVYRASASLALLFALQLLSALCYERARYLFHHYLFGLKVAFVPLTFTALLFVQNSAFSMYGTISTAWAFVYLVAQSIAFIDLGYTWNKAWVTRGELEVQQSRGTGRNWFGGILSVSILLIAAMIGLTVVSSRLTTSSWELWVLGVTVVFATLLTAASVTHWIPHGALLPGALASLLATYQTTVAISQWSESPYKGEALRLTFGLAAAAIAVGFISRDVLCCGRPSRRRSLSAIGVRTRSSRGDLTPWAQHGDDGALMQDHPAADELQIRSRSDSGMSDEENDMREVRTHVVHDAIPAVVFDTGDGDGITRWDDKSLDVAQIDFYLLAFSVYLSVLCTDWRQDVYSFQSRFDKSVIFWEQIAASWVTLLLYAWTLIAPYILVDRDFS